MSGFTAKKGIYGIYYTKCARTAGLAPSMPSQSDWKVASAMSSHELPTRQPPLHRTVLKSSSGAMEILERSRPYSTFDQESDRLHRDKTVAQEPLTPGRMPPNRTVGESHRYIEPRHKRYLGGLSRDIWPLARRHTRFNRFLQGRCLRVSVPNITRLCCIISYDDTPAPRQHRLRRKHGQHLPTTSSSSLLLMDSVMRLQHGSVGHWRLEAGIDRHNYIELASYSHMCQYSDRPERCASADPSTAIRFFPTKISFYQNLFRIELLTIL